MLRIHSMESFWTHDGPGIRFVLFLQWCMFKCLYCHNPDTIPCDGGKMMSADEIVDKVVEMKPYFWTKWWFTVSGWEPLLQSKWLIELFIKLKAEGINIVVDTNGFPWNDDVKSAVELADLFMVDIKQINNNQHIKLTWQENTNTLKFINYLESQKKKMRIRYVLLPGYTDHIEDIEEIWERYWSYEFIERLEILPYHHLWVHKWKELWWKYELENVWYPSLQKIEQVKSVFEKYFKKVLVR